MPQQNHQGRFGCSVTEKVLYTVSESGKVFSYGGFYSSETGSLSRLGFYNIVIEQQICICFVELNVYLIFI